MSKCWSYREEEPFEEEPNTKFVFAETEQEALEAVADRLNEFVTDLDPTRLQRKEAFDKHFPGPVPLQALLDDGWWFDCLECHKKVTQDGCECADNSCDVEGCECVDTCVCKPVIAGDMVFCSPACLGDWREDRRLDREYERELRCRAEKMFPGITIRDAIGCRADDDGSVRFDVPGTKVGIRWHTKEPTVVYVAPLDMEAWTAYESNRIAKRSPTTPEVPQNRPEDASVDLGPPEVPDGVGG